MLQTSKKCTTWELQVKFHLWQNEDCSQGESIDRTIAREIALGNCSKEAGGKVSIYVISVKKEYMQSSTYSFFFFIFFISWRLITLQYCSGFCHTLSWISHGFTHIPHPYPPPTSLSTWSLWVFPVHQARALVSCIQPGLVICFTLDNIHV